MLVRILIWCALGYAGGWIAARKGYPPFLGAVVGVLIGPIGLVVGALLPRTKEGREQAKLDRELAVEAAALNKRQNCPSCGREQKYVACAGITCGELRVPITHYRPQCVEGNGQQHRQITPGPNLRHCDRRRCLVPPFQRICARWTKPTKYRRRELIDVEAQNNGKVFVHEGAGRFLPYLALSPTGLLATRGHRYPYTQLDIENTLLRFTKLVEEVRGDNAIRVSRREGGKINGRACTVF